MRQFRTPGSVRGRSGNRPSYLYGDSHLLVKITLLILLCFVLSACSPATPNQTRSEINGTQQERIIRATAILTKYCQLPGPLLDAHMAEDVRNHSASSVPGPSYSSLSGVVLVAPADLPAWRAVLSPAAPYVAPPEFTSACHLPAPLWWPASTALARCEFYTPTKLTGRHGGFVAVSSSHAAIYFSTF